MKIYIVEAITTNNKYIKFFFDDEDDLNHFINNSTDGIYRKTSVEIIHLIEFSTQKVTL